MISSKILNPSFLLARYFSDCSSLCILLEKRMLRTTQQMVGFAIIHQAYSSQKSAANPFMTFILNAACNDEYEKCERALILQLLASDSSNGGRENFELFSRKFLMDVFPPDSRTWTLMMRHYSMNGRYDEGLSLFLKNLKSSVGYKPNHQVLATVLKCCSALSKVGLGKSLQGYVVKLGHLSCQAVSKGLINMYAKCGYLSDSQCLFDQTPNCDSVVWNILLSGFSGSRVYQFEAMRMFHRMHESGESPPNSVTIAIILPVCARLGYANAGRSVHAYAIKFGLETDTLARNALLSMYAKCGLVCEAYDVFNCIDYKDIVSWNAIISGLAENRLMGESFKVFNKMLTEANPNPATIANILPVCASFSKNIAYCCAREIHSYVQRRCKLSEDVSVCNALLSCYIRAGRNEEAETLFGKMISRDLVSWNSIIAGYASYNDWSKALNLFEKLLSSGEMEPDFVTIVSVLPACARLHNLRLGKEIHCYALRRPCLQEHLAVGNALVSFYAKCGIVEAAFGSFKMLSKRDMISWNAILDAFAKSGYETQFLDILDGMHKEKVKPDVISILTIIELCNISGLNKVKETHCYSLKVGFLAGDSYSLVGNKFVDAYGKCKNVEYSFQIFKSLTETRKLVTCDSIVSGKVNFVDDKDTDTLFGTSKMDLTTWNLMIQAYAENDYLDHACNIFHDLQIQGMKPNALTIMALLPVCAKMVSTHLSRQCHGYVIRTCLADVHLMAALLDVYAKSGSISSACKLFQSSPYKDLVMFTAMASGYAMHGMGDEALKVFNNMLELGIKPDNVIITVIISACSHSGLVSEGVDIFFSMEKIHRIKPTIEQYACLVDLLARGGQIGDAFSFVDRMDIKANATVWGTLLGACKTHYEMELGRVASNRLFEMEANNIGNYIVMSNLYATDGRWEGVLEVRKLLRSRELKKPAGCSWIEVEGIRNVFMAADSAHPQRSIVYNLLSILDQQIKDPSSVLTDRNLQHQKYKSV